MNIETGRRSFNAFLGTLARLKLVKWEYFENGNRIERQVPLFVYGKYVGKFK